VSEHFEPKDNVLNQSTNPTFAEVVTPRLSRRTALKQAGALVLGSAPFAQAIGALFMSTVPGGNAGASDLASNIGFQRISASTADLVRVPQGYSVSVLYRWGDAIGAPHLPAGAPAFRPDAGNTPEEQALQAGMHHDGMHFFPLPDMPGLGNRGLLAVNHEYTDDGLLHPDGMRNWSAEKVAKAQASHGVSVVEIAEIAGRWDLVRPSRYARRVTATTPMRLAGPVARSALVRTTDDASGMTVLGTFANCAHGHTPWGTYLACEENWHNYFVQPNAADAHEQRYGINARGGGFRWNEFDPRFDVARNPNEPNRFGYVVEIDPFDPESLPVKRTALGRFKHESATLSVAPDGRIVLYMGDDERFEYIYKFVSRDPWNRFDRAANRDLLDHGTLYVARFDEDGRGTWLPLVHGMGPLNSSTGFADQAEVLVKARQAADVVGATKMDRPEWIAVHPRSREVYCSLTNNTERGKPGKTAPDPANPRANNAFGHIARWREAGGNPAASTFSWDIFVLAGNGDPDKPDMTGNIKGDLFGSPDGLWFDAQGRLWIETDVSTNSLNKDDYAIIGNNQLLVADIASGEIKRFLTGPAGCEITGITMPPDGRSLFVNIQHPGETPSERSDPGRPKAVSSWPDGSAGQRPRSATIVIQKDDGGIIGT
jgi:secreted PhoX family phosphatase